jgi:hypothetical protein
MNASAWQTPSSSPCCRAASELRLRLDGASRSRGALEAALRSLQKLGRQEDADAGALRKASAAAAGCCCPACLCTAVLCGAVLCCAVLISMLTCCPRCPALPCPALPAVERCIAEAEQCGELLLPEAARAREAVHRWRVATAAETRLSRALRSASLPSGPLHLFFS